MYNKWKHCLNGVSENRPSGPLAEYTRAVFDEHYLRGVGAVSVQYNSNWLLPETDRGGVRFNIANAPDNIWVDLGGIRSDIFGYVVVVGSQPGIYRKAVPSMIMRPSQPHLYPQSNFAPVPLQHAQSVDIGGREALIVVTYNYGHIHAFCNGQEVLHGYDAGSAPGVQQIGIGVWSTTSGDAESKVSQVYPLLL